MKPGAEAEVIAAFGPLTIASRKEPGCRMYIAHQHQEDSTRFLVYEQYDDEAALDAHRNSPHFQQYAANGLYKHVIDRQVDIFRPL